MAISILKTPSDTNAGNEVVFSISSSNSNEPQFRYVIDTYMSSSAGQDLLNRSFTYPNTYGTSNINFSSMFNDYLEYEDNWTVTGSLAASGSNKMFTIKFGEQYSVSLDATAVTYPDLTSATWFAFPGKAYKSETGTYSPNVSYSSLLQDNQIMSWAPQAKYTSPFTQFGPDTNILLTNDDYHTITTPVSWYWVVEWRGAGSGTIYSENLYPGPASPSSYLDIYTYGIGPKNLTELSGSWQAYFDDTSVDYVRVKNQFGAGPSYDYNLKGRAYDTTCESEYTRFAFINRFGFYDYYSIYNPLRKSTRVDRSFYTRPYVRYEDEIWLNNPSNRGSIQYNTEYQDDFQITTDFLSTATAEWLSELFDSPRVFIHKDGEFIPIIITNTNQIRNLNSSRNKLFQYEIQFRYANQRQSR